MANKLGVRIMVGIPTTSQARVSPIWIQGKNFHLPLGSSAAERFIVDETIAAARNALCQEALNLGCDYLFFLSDDVIAPANAIMHMLEKIDRTFPDEQGNMVTANMVTGIYWTKTYPTDPYIWRGVKPGTILKGPYKNWKEGEFFPVDIAGVDCLLVSTKVLRAMKEAFPNDPDPWFSTNWIWEEGQTPSSIATEDYYFYLKARTLGFRLFADTAVQCLHEDRNTGILFGLRSDMPQAGGDPLFGDDKLHVADIGAGTESPYFGDNVTLVRFDGRENVNPDYRVDITQIPEMFFEEFDVAHARHVLEHFPRNQTTAILAHWARLVKPGGKLIIKVPNLGQSFKDILNPNAPPDIKKRAWDEIYGAQSYPYDFHMQGFTKAKLEAALKTIPNVQSVTVDVVDYEGNLNGVAVIGAFKYPALTEFMDTIAEREHPPQPVEQDLAIEGVGEQPALSDSGGDDGGTNAPQVQP